MQRALDGGPVVVPAEEHSVFCTLYAEDAADAWLQAIASPAAANQTYHIAMKEIMTAERWAGLVWAAAGQESSVTFVPRAVIDKDASLKGGYEPPLLRRSPYIQDLGKAEREFGYKTTPVAEWIEQ